MQINTVSELRDLKSIICQDEKEVNSNKEILDNIVIATCGNSTCGKEFILDARFGITPTWSHSFPHCWTMNPYKSARRL